MNAKIWFISDLHLFHANMLRSGKIHIRPFDTLAEMHARIIEGWNSVVKPGHKVYMMGDLTLIRNKHQELPRERQADLSFVWEIVRELNGHKRMLLGNHDHCSVEEYKAMGFEKVMAYREMAGILFSHIPVHPSQFYRFRGNVHGHLHESTVMLDDFHMGAIFPDYRYINVCVEPRNYVPMSLEEIVAHYDALEKP